MLIQLYKESRCFKELEKEWLALLSVSSTNTIFLTPQLLETWWATLGHTKGELAVITVRNSNYELVALAPLYLCQEKNETLLRLLGEPDLCDYGDLIMKLGYEEEVLPELLSFLKGHLSWERLEIHCVPEESTVFNRLRILFESNGLKLHEEFQDNCPSLMLPATWDQYLELLRAKDRHELRRKLRRWERQSDSAWRLAGSPDTLDADLEAFLLLHRQSKLEKKRFMDERRSDFFLRLGQRLVQEGWLYLSFLEEDGKKIASLFCFDYSNTIHIYNSGYDPEFSHLSPGLICLALTLRDAISKGRTYFDFLRGEEPYKYRFGAKDKPILSLTIYR
ncbi:MAG: GNAT family N-acetyltransferase [Candidatus Tectomicrobia bacterium]|uniref:GNAT family N-acetyltransferase n=1 Tax=Tectimicrobiota bacterium TaxID=2528274 RepID=A0A933LQU4_UNCTE|nr:GNAT family N-acetyltransferase [Candidatus Tectomicrobia bacterium]